MGVGVAVGVVTLIGQSMLSAEWNRLANSGAIWLLASFLVGSRMPTIGRAAIAGMATLVLAVVSYYVAAKVAGAGVSTRMVVIWVGTALVGGPVYGAAGYWWRTGPLVRRVIAIGLMGGIVTAEGVSTLLRIPDLAAVGWVEAVAGLGLVILLGRSRANACSASPCVPFVVLAGVARLRGSSTASSPPDEPGYPDANASRPVDGTPGGHGGGLGGLGGVAVGDAVPVPVPGLAGTGHRLQHRVRLAGADGRGGPRRRHHHDRPGQRLIAAHVIDTASLDPRERTYAAYDFGSVRAVLDVLTPFEVIAGSNGSGQEVQERPSSDGGHPRAECRFGSHRERARLGFRRGRERDDLQRRLLEARHVVVRHRHARLVRWRRTW